MFCPFCGDSSTRVVDSRLADQAVRRRRECPKCDKRFTTYERYDQGPLYIRKRDGSRQEFDRKKLLAGLERAAIKRPVEREQLEAIVDRIVAELRHQGGTPEVDTVGELALLCLREVDQVAYVRFASVYKNFADVAEFEAELERIEHEPPLQTTTLFEDADGPGSIRIQSHSRQFTPKAGKERVSTRSEGRSEGLSEGKPGELED